MSLIDPVWYCYRCRENYLDSETISAKFSDEIPYCPKCEKRDEMWIMHSGKLLRNWRQSQQENSRLREVLKIIVNYWFF